MSNKKTLVVNLFSGPGAGKSTMAAELFAKLKWEGIDCELVTEFAKELVWEQRHDTFRNQIYIFGKQHQMVFRVLGKVDVVVTDSPFILSAVYDEYNRETFRKLILEEYLKCYNRNFFIYRQKPYNPNGRNQNEEGAKEIDARVLDFLIKWDLPYELIYGSPNGVKIMFESIVREYYEKKTV